MASSDTAPEACASLMAVWRGLVGLGSTLNLRASLSHVLEVLEKSHGTHSGSVVLRDEEAGDLAVEAATGRGAEMAGRTRYRLGEGITGRVVQSGRPVVVPRVSREPLFLNKTRVFKSGGELSFVCVPIKADARTVGALGVTFAFAEDRGFDQEAKFFGTQLKRLTAPLKQSASYIIFFI